MMYPKIFVSRLHYLCRQGTGKVCCSFRYYSQKWFDVEDPRLESSALPKEDFSDHGVLKTYLGDKIKTFGYISSNCLSELQVSLRIGKHGQYSSTAAKLLIDHCGRWCADQLPRIRIGMANEIFRSVRHKSIFLHNSYLQSRVQNENLFEPSVVEEKLAVAKLHPTRHTLLQFLGQYAHLGDVPNALDVIDRHKEHNFKILPIALGYLAFAYGTSGEVNKCLEIVHQQQIEKNVNWHFYCLVCSGLVEAGAVGKAVEIFVEGNHELNEPVSIIPFVQLLEKMLNKELQYEATLVIESLPGCGQQLLMHAIHHLTPWSGGIELVKLLQKKLESPILESEPEIVDSARSLIWQCLSECESFDHLLSHLTLTQSSFVNVPVLDFALEIALCSNKKYSRDLLLKFKNDGCLKTHFVLPLLFSENSDQNLTEMYEFAQGVVDSPKILKEIANVLATKLKTKPNWWLVYLFLLKLELHNQANKFLLAAKSMPSKQIIEDSFDSCHVGDVLMTNASLVVEQCRGIEEFPITHLWTALICILCDHGAIAEACEHATDLYSHENKLDTKIQITLLQGSLSHNAPLPSSILEILSEDLQKIEKNIHGKNTEATLETLCGLLSKNPLISDSFVNCIVDSLPTHVSLQGALIANKTLENSQTSKNYVIRKRIFQNLFEACPEDAFQFVVSLCFHDKQSPFFFKWLLIQFMELCSEHSCPDLLQKLSSYQLDQTLSTKLAAHQALIGIKSGKWIFPKNEHTRFFHLTMLNLTIFLANKSARKYAKKLIELAEMQNNAYLLETTYANLIAAGYTHQIAYSIRNKLSNQNVANIRVSAYRTAFNPDSLIGADKTMRSVSPNSAKWNIILNFYLFRQTIHLVSKNKTYLEELYDYLQMRYNSVGQEENFSQTKDWLNKLFNAQVSGDFEAIDLEVKNLKEQKSQTVIRDIRSKHAKSAEPLN